MTSLGVFKNEDDVNNQLTNYKQILAAQIRNARRNEDIFSQSFKDGVSVSQVVPMQYKNAEQEEQDKNLQYQKAFQSIQTIFKYPDDAKKTVEKLNESYNLADVNRFLPAFLGELKTTNLTPTYFLSQWDRFYTRLQSQGDSLINIGIQDDRERYFNQQKINTIKTFLKKGDLSPKELNLMNKRLDRLVQQSPDKIGVLLAKKEKEEKSILDKIEDFNAGRAEITPTGETFEEKKQSILEQQNKQIQDIVNDLKNNLGIGRGKEKIGKVQTGLEEKVEQKLLPERMERISSGEELTSLEQKFVSQFNVKKLIKAETAKLKLLRTIYLQKLDEAEGNLKKQKDLLEQYRMEADTKLNDFEQKGNEQLQDLWDNFYLPKIQDETISREQAMAVLQRENNRFQDNLQKLKLENLSRVSEFRDEIKKQISKENKAESQLEKLQKRKEQIEEQKKELEFTPGPSIKPKFKTAIIEKPERRRKVSEQMFFSETPRRFSIQELQSPERRSSVESESGYFGEEKEAPGQEEMWSFGPQNMNDVKDIIKKKKYQIQFTGDGKLSPYNADDDDVSRLYYDIFEQYPMSGPNKKQPNKSELIKQINSRFSIKKGAGKNSGETITVSDIIDALPYLKKNGQYKGKVHTDKVLVKKHLSKNGIPLQKGGNILTALIPGVISLLSSL